MNHLLTGFPPAPYGLLVETQITQKTSSQWHQSTTCRALSTCQFHQWDETSNVRGFHSNKCLCCQLFVFSSQLICCVLKHEWAERRWWVTANSMSWSSRFFWTVTFWPPELRHSWDEAPSAGRASSHRCNFYLQSSKSVSANWAEQSICCSALKHRVTWKKDFKNSCDEM